MCAMIGASRILHALALDHLFGKAHPFFFFFKYFFYTSYGINYETLMVFLKGLPLAPAAITSASGNPWVAVLFTWGLTQVSSCSPQVRVFEIGTGWLTCSLWLVAVRGVCRGAQCDSRFGDCFLLTCLRCSWLGLFGAWVGISSKFQVMSTDCILKDGCSLWIKKKWSQWTNALN